MTEYISTKIRPIRKLFIIETNNFEAFENILKSISSDIEMIFNIIFINNENIFTKLNKEVVKRQNIDIILNLSKLENSVIEDNFLIETFTPDTDSFKIERFVTDFRFISNLPSLIAKYNDDKKEKVFYSNQYNKDDCLSAVSSINFGLYLKEDDDLIEKTVFKDLDFILCDIENIKENIFNKELYFSRIYNIINPFSSGYGSSIYEIDYSHEKEFKDLKNYIFISSLRDLDGLLNFWNMRALNPHKDFFWFPEEYIDSLKELVDSEMIFVVNNEQIKEKIKSNSFTNQILLLDKLYFYGNTISWKLYEYSQNINILDKENILISHPIEKSFSEFGMGGACIFEISGLKEFFLPNHAKLGILFEKKSYKDLFPERFTHLFNKKISKYYLDINPLEIQNLIVNLRLPTFKETIEFIFDSKNYKLKSTNKTFIFDQLINSSGGLNQIKQLCSDNVFKLIEEMTPRIRTKDIAQDLSNEDKVHAEVNKKLNNGDIQLTPKIKDYNEINRILKNDELFQLLYDKKYLLRGKHFKCSHCSSYIWLSLGNINRINYCDTCNNEIQIPINKNDGIDKFRINQLLINSYDQGQISTLLLLNFFTQNTFLTLEYLSNQEIFKKNESTAYTDLDLIIKIGNKIGFTECKSTSNFSNKQIDDLFKIGEELKCDFYILSSLKTKNDEELLNSLEYIKTKNIQKPIFIFTKEVLFNTKDIKFYKYFEVKNNEFQNGVIIVE
jgi:hypothetical protein